MKSLLTIVVLSVALASCSLEQVDDAFNLPMYEYDEKWNPDLQWAIEDVHMYVNIETEENATRYYQIYDKKYRNGTCLLSAERKYELALRFGYDERDLEIVVIKLTEDAALKADWSNGWPTHAVLRYKDEVFDNGFITETPFDIEYLDRYGEKIEDVWSRYQK